MTEVTAHITGTVWKVLIQVGQAVDEEQTLVILESMKMEMPVLAPVSGTVRELRVAEGDAVEEDDVLAIID